MINHQFWMSKALQLARQGIYTTHPNPRVGCVIVKNNQLIGQGWHQRAGEPHAEVYALRQAGEQAKGATLYVTLEPCSHYGRTPPCAAALIKAQLAHVVVATQDPNPLVAGKGLTLLTNAGIKVTCGILAAEAIALNRGFIKRMQHGLPYVSIKLAMSLDGRTAMANGESQWITGQAARSEVQRIRAQSSAIMTGADTVLYDNAKLTVRASELGLDQAATELALQRVPLRVLLDTKARVGLDKAFYQTGQSLTFSNQPAPAGLALDQEWLTLPTEQGHLNLRQVLTCLAQDYQVNELLVEAGASLAGALTVAKLVDEYLIFMAAKWMGSAARPLLQLPLTTMNEAIALAISDIRAIGADWLITAHPQC